MVPMIATKNTATILFSQDYFPPFDLTSPKSWSHISQFLKPEPQLKELLESSTAQSFIRTLKMHPPQLKLEQEQ